MTITVYRAGVAPGVQYLILDNAFQLRREGKLPLDGRSRLSDWPDLEVYSPYPRLPEPDIWKVMGISSGFAMTDRTRRLFEECLVGSGEWLPLRFRGEELHFLNILEDVDCLDEPKSEFFYGSTGKRLYPPIRYSFVLSRLPESSVFKIPETDFAEVLTFEGRYPDGEFKPLVESLGATGLRFEPVWSTNQG